MDNQPSEDSTKEIRTGSVTTVPDSFDEAMLDIYRKADRELGIKFKNFLDRIVTLGALNAARHFLREPLQSGFTTLWERGRLDLTMEALVIRPEWAGLFTQRELDEAKTRLQAHGWNDPNA
jgi:hypothetical protein